MGTSSRASHRAGFSFQLLSTLFADAMETNGHCLRGSLAVHRLQKATEITGILRSWIPRSRVTELAKAAHSEARPVLWMPYQVPSLVCCLWTSVTDSSVVVLEVSLL